METNDYQKQALDFLEKTGTKMEIKFLKTGYHFADDKKNGKILPRTKTGKQAKARSFRKRC